MGQQPLGSALSQATPRPPLLCSTWPGGLPLTALPAPRFHELTYKKQHSGHVLSQGLADYNLWAKSGPLSVCVYKVLLAHRHTHSFTYHLCLFLSNRAETVWPKPENIYCPALH